MNTWKTAAKKLLSFVLLLFILVITPNTFFTTAQEPIPTATETPTIAPSPTSTETAIFTETSTIVPSPTFTDTPIPAATFTETPSLTPTFTETPIPTPTAMPAETAAAISMTPDLTQTPTETATWLAPTPSAPTTSFSSEPLMTMAHSAVFDYSQFAEWTVGEGWTPITLPIGQALHSLQSGASLEYNQTYQNVAAQIQFWAMTGVMRLSVRQSEAGAYTATLDRNGLVELYRAETLLQSMTVGGFIGDYVHTLRISSIDSVIRVTVDGQQFIEVVDNSPLPGGIIRITCDTISDLYVTQFELSVPQAEAPVAIPEEALDVQAEGISSFSPEALEETLSSSTTSIAYTRNGEVFVTSGDVQGAGTIQITNTPGINEYNPVLSPDGTKLAYHRNGAIYVIDANNGYRNDIWARGTFGGWAANSVTFSFVALVGSTCCNNTEVFVQQGRYGVPRRITTNSVMESSSSLSPAGNVVIYKTEGTPVDVFGQYFDTSTIHAPVNLTNTPTLIEHTPRWATEPNTNKIVYARGQLYGLAITNLPNPPYIGVVGSPVPFGLTSGALGGDWSPAPSNRLLYVKIDSSIVNTYTLDAIGANLQLWIPNVSSDPSWAGVFQLGTPTPTPTPFRTNTPIPTVIPPTPIGCTVGSSVPVVFRAQPSQSFPNSLPSANVIMTIATADPIGSGTQITPSNSYLWTNGQLPPNGTTITSITLLGRYEPISWVDTDITWYFFRVFTTFNSQIPLYGYIGAELTFNSCGDLSSLSVPHEPLATIMSGIEFTVGRRTDIPATRLSMFGFDAQNTPSHQIAPAVMGGCFFHNDFCGNGDGPTVDLIPRILELCIDGYFASFNTPLSQNFCDLPNVNPNVTSTWIPIYSPVAGWVLNSTSPTVLIALDPPSTTNNRRAISITHIYPTVSAGAISAGALIGYLCPQSKATEICEVIDGVPTHVAFELLYIQPDGSPIDLMETNWTQIQRETETRSFLAFTTCLYDDWQQSSITATRPSSPISNCPYAG
jgi:hypothetical protein